MCAYCLSVIENFTARPAFRLFFRHRVLFCVSTMFLCIATVSFSGESILDHTFSCSNSAKSRSCAADVSQPCRPLHGFRGARRGPQFLTYGILSPGPTSTVVSSPPSSLECQLPCHQSPKSQSFPRTFYLQSIRCLLCSSSVKDSSSKVGGLSRNGSLSIILTGTHRRFPSTRQGKPTPLHPLSSHMALQTRRLSKAQTLS